jgi:hypothetical protein
MNTRPQVYQQADRDAYAAETSWWAEAPRESFTSVAQREFETRMKYTVFARTTGITTAPRVESARDSFLARKRYGAVD